MGPVFVCFWLYWVSKQKGCLILTDTIQCKDKLDIRHKLLTCIQSSVGQCCSEDKLFLVYRVWIFLYLQKLLYLYCQIYTNIMNNNAHKKLGLISSISLLNISSYCINVSPSEQLLIRWC